MITRDNKFSISGTAQNARQRLGEVLKFYREDRQITVRDVSRRAKVAVGLVEKWESGEQLPNREEWKALCHGINRALNTFNDLYLRAREEADTEARERAQTNMKEQKPVNPTTKINTALGDKLAHVQIAAAPMSDARTVKPGHAVPHEPPLIPIRLVQNDEPEPTMATETDPRKLQAVRPRGSHEPSQIARRKAYVRELLVQRPKIRTQGADSVVEAVRKAFGIGISPETVDEIREELQHERIKSEILRDLPPPAPPTLPGMAAQLAEHVTSAAPIIPPAPKANDNPEADLNAAVSMILDAIPNLQTFTIAIDEHGEASIDYQIRKVKIETVGGSFKVKR